MYEQNPERTLFFGATVRIDGKGGHSSVPYQTHNPIPAAFRLIQCISGKLLYEFTSFQNVALFPVSFDAGTQQNIIPDGATVLFRGEATCAEDTAQLKALLTATADAIARLYHLTIACTYEG